MPDNSVAPVALPDTTSVVVHDAAAAVLTEQPVAAESVVDGQPVIGHLALWEQPDGRACGIWAHSVGTSSDVEVDETFVVLSGRAIVESGGHRIEIGPGDVGVLAAGTKTIWTILEPLRKVYITGPTHVGTQANGGVEGGADPGANPGGNPGGNPGDNPGGNPGNAPG